MTAEYQNTEMHGDITDVPGIRVGIAQDDSAKTGVTVVLPPSEGAPAGLHIGGSAPSTRQTDSLNPLHVVDRVHAICFCGGSAFGLDAAGGVLSALEDMGVGFQVVGNTVPIVPSAAIFDLNLGNGSVRPDKTMGRNACENASGAPVKQGSFGAGTGASVGKLFGVDHAMKGGQGSASAISGQIVVGGLVILNAYGDITDPRGNLLAGARLSPDSMDFADAKKLLVAGKAESRRLSAENTTLAVIAVNAKLNKLTASRIAAQATQGMSRLIRPFHSQVDGDLTIVMSVGEHYADPNRIALMAQDVLEKAVINAVVHADGMGVLPAWKDLAHPVI
jgi:L-aminopeptidase/D-esterase-like protein